MKENKTISKLTIKNNHIYLDDLELKGVQDYEVKSSAPNKIAELTLKLIISTVKIDS
ncbi:hypothetical protein [Paraclostridium sordellii]|uniref:hypothetical protein n=1 Tax=Paraclostridium sordellii TaxID=1505 RepID=UPI0005DC86CD|nr:hypothetical protein [Paeniclostridium sordellii]CEQ14819.1 Uncharacterised protein [[Clostridium] sordellii] [Paeniclostridium sordellii]